MLTYSFFKTDFKVDLAGVPFGKIQIIYWPDGLRASALVSDFTSQVQRHREFTPDNIFILAPSYRRHEPDIETSLGLFTHGSLRIDEYRTKLGVLFWNGKSAKTIDGQDIPEPLHRTIIYTGITHLINRYDVIINCPNLFHFVKPSKKHNSFFIRTGNLLVDHAAIDFIAMICNSYIPDDTKNIYFDSSSIMILGYAINGIRRKYAKNELRFDSFNSYDGVSEKIRSDVVGDNSVFFISASMSGGLVHSLVGKPGIKPKSTVTIIGDNVSHGGWAIFRVNSEYTSVKIEKEPDEEHENCKWCKTGSSLLSMSNEGFIPRLELKGDYVIDREAPAIVSPKKTGFLELASLPDAFLVWVKDNQYTGNPEFSLDFLKVLKNGKSTRYIDELQSTIIRVVRDGIKYMIVSEGDETSYFAKYINRVLVEMGREKLTMIRHQELKVESSRIQIKRKLKDETIILITEIVLSSGRKLLEINRDLRDVVDQKCEQIYLCAAGITVTAKLHSKIKKTLGDIGHSAGNKVEAPLIFVLPRPVFGTTTWDEEYSLLGKLKNEYPKSKFIKDRFDHLSGVSSRGMSDKIFLNDNKNRSLLLRKSFAFWPEYDYGDRHISQASVYFTVASMMQAEREKRRLDSFYVESLSKVGFLLSAHNFDRYNDGVIQASLLRSALPGEIDYRDSSENSRFISDLIIRMIRGYRKSDPMSEALNEFLLSLTMNRLRLCREHFKRVVDEGKIFRSISNSGPFAFISYLEKMHGV